MASILSNLSIWRQTDVRSEHNKDVSVRGDVMAVSLESNFTNEWQASEAAHIEAFSPEVGMPSIQTSIVVIDLINAYTACEESVLGMAPQRQHGVVNFCECIRC